MKFLKDNQKYLTYPKMKSFTEREWITYKVIRETNRKYVLENGVHVSKSSGRELCPNDSNRPFVNQGRYHNEDKSCMGIGID